jgi:hypothetical protein
LKWLEKDDIVSFELSENIKKLLEKW